jgi:hypothetical protein
MADTNARTGSHLATCCAPQINNHNSGDGYSYQRAVIVPQNRVRCVANQVSRENDKSQHLPSQYPAEQTDRRCSTTGTDQRHQ